MGNSYERALWLIEKTIKELENQKIWKKGEICRIQRRDFAFTWFKTGLSLTSMDCAILILKSQYILGEYARKKIESDYDTKGTGYYVDFEKLEEFKKGCKK